MSIVNFFTLHLKVRSVEDILSFESYRLANKSIYLSFSHPTTDKNGLTYVNIYSKRYLNHTHFESYVKGIKRIQNLLYTLSSENLNLKVIELNLLRFYEIYDNCSEFFRNTKSFELRDSILKFLENLDASAILELNRQIKSECSHLEKTYLHRLINCAIHILVCSNCHKELGLIDIVTVAKHYLLYNYTSKEGQLYLELDGKLHNLKTQSLVNTIYLNAIRQDSLISV